MTFARLKDLAKSSLSDADGQKRNTHKDVTSIQRREKNS